MYDDDGHWIGSYFGEKRPGDSDGRHCEECGAELEHPLPDECPECGASTAPF